MSVKGFKLSDGTVVKYDYSALENIETDDTLSRSGVAADAKAVGDEITDIKEDFESLESEVSTLADAVTLSAYNNDKTPYLFRPSGGGKYIGGIEKDVIVGGTVAWNQLIPTNKVHDTSTKNGITATNNNDGTVTLTGTSTALTPIELTYSIFDFQNGHKYYVGSGGANFRIYDGYNAHGYGIMNFGGDTGSATTLYALIENGATVNAKIPVSAFDLTQLFGSTIADYIYSLETATAGSGVAKLKSWGFFTEDYYPYDAGSLKSVEGLVSHDMVGFNQWDEEWELGSINTSGADTTATDRIRSKSYIPCSPNASYYVKTPVGLNFRFYDESKTIISYSTYTNTVFTTPANCRYMRFASSAGYTVYTNDICINLSSSRNGQYEPYQKHSYALDSDLTLRGIPKLDSGNNLYYDGDVYGSDGVVKRKYGVITATQIKASYNGFNADHHVYASYLSGALNAVVSQTPANAICNVLQVNGTWTEMQAYSASGMYHNSSWDYTRLYLVLPSTVTTKEQAEAWLDSSGIEIVYELATPTTETAEPYQNPQIVDKDGTEEYVTTGIVPVGHDTEYYLDADSVLTPPTTAGTYSLKVTVASDGSKSYSWVSDQY